MVAALTYVLTSITLAVLLAISGRRRHQTAEDIDQFRYQSALLRVTFAGTVFILLVPFIVYFFATPNREATQLFIPLCIFGFVAAIFA
jgi:hypothetical protein